MADVEHQEQEQDEQLSFETAVHTFLEAVGKDLTPADAPARVSLVLLARQLDGGGFHPQTYSQFALTYRSLLKRVSSGDEHDPLQGLLFGDD